MEDSGSKACPWGAGAQKTLSATTEKLPEALKGVGGISGLPPSLSPVKVSAGRKLAHTGTGTAVSITQPSCGSE